MRLPISSHAPCPRSELGFAQGSRPLIGVIIARRSAAFPTADEWGRHGRWCRSGKGSPASGICWRSAWKITAVFHVSVGNAVIVHVRPDRAGKSTNGPADHSVRGDAHRHGNRSTIGTRHPAAYCGSYDSTRIRIKAGRGAAVISTLVGIAGDVTGVVGVGPNRPGKTAHSRSDSSTSDRVGACRYTTRRRRRAR